MSVGVKMMKVRVKSNINEYLESRGTTKAWLADKIGATRSQMNNWSKNDDNGVLSQPSIGYVLRMKRVLGCEVEDLFEEM